MGPPSKFSPLADLPPDVLVHIADFMSLQERLTLSLVCKQLYEAMRWHGARLWGALRVNFGDAATLASFEAWRRHTACSPHILMLQHGEWGGADGADSEAAQWSQVVAAACSVLPSLTHLMIRWEGEAAAGEWLAGGTRLQDLGLYCSSLAVHDTLATLTQLRDLSLESTETPLVLQPGACLPAGLTKLFAVESHMTEVPEAVSGATALECAYLSRNPLAPPSLARLAALPRLQLLSLIGCWFERPPHELSALTSLRALYLDYNKFGNESEASIQGAFSAALAPLARLQALGLSHNYLDSFPDAVEHLPRLRVLYLESNPGIARLPPSAGPVLSRLRTLSCDCSVLFSNAGMLRTARRLEHLFVSGSGLMWHAIPAAAPTDEVLAALAALAALKRVTFVVQTQKEEVASVEVVQLMLELPRRCPGLVTEALDSEAFYGVTLKELDAMAEEEEAAEEEQQRQQEQNGAARDGA